MSPVYLWIVAGTILCLVEVIFPVDFVAVVMGLSAVATAGVALLVPGSFALQSLCWLGLSVLSIILLRRFLPRPRQKSILRDAVEGQCLTAILPGETGRVLYEGNSWRAECQDPDVAIAIDEKVYVVGRSGNTLLVYPANALQGRSDIQHPNF
ncbi:MULTISPECIES: NfeD family protein [Synechocystis]|uniref:NfeD family protein n=1 Tax=Synechocystis salina LEGE 00031 TaxID=1828736 RepID=A0ABR9VVV6_9SYNC|nr:MULTISPECIES: NfeD family protein [Synechocystis]MBD2653568.1 NfeD family protein [Synechocystis sp. FACHB-383]MBE9194480.1 NfeD family protein [Synechocystis sp. LEGE 06083]MBE9242596.1 NfeD family protein [Synechocystis salina LEGE 00041]MBE9255495.1 NfeD family protein [Synechocystis salina LEGE 00031]